MNRRKIANWRIGWILIIIMLMLSICGCTKTKKSESANSTTEATVVTTEEPYNELITDVEDFVSNMLPAETVESVINETNTATMPNETAANEKVEETKEVNKNDEVSPEEDKKENITESDEDTGNTGYVTGEKIVLEEETDLDRNIPDFG